MCERRREHRLFLAVTKSPVVKADDRPRQGPAFRARSACGFVGQAVFHAVGFALDDDGLGPVQ